MRGVVIHSALMVCFVLVLGSFGFAAKGPSVGDNVLVDLDRDQAFPKNKQNEPAITRDPLTGTLVVGANDELDEPLCSGTTVPLTSPCPSRKACRSRSSTVPPTMDGPGPAAPCRALMRSAGRRAAIPASTSARANAPVRSASAAVR